MCGRYLLDADYEALIERYKIFEDFRDVYEKKIEIFPSQSILTVVHKDHGRTIQAFVWGLKIMPKRNLINSRIETILSGDLYSRLQPCIVPATGYYEWEKVQKQKCKITSDTGLLNMAGLYDSSSKTVSIITTKAHASIEHVHDRMPLIIETEELENWLTSLKIKAFLKDFAHKKALNFTVENLEPTMQLSFFNDDFIK